MGSQQLAADVPRLQFPEERQVRGWLRQKTSSHDDMINSAPLLKRFPKQAAREQAAKLAADCYDINGNTVVRVENPKAVGLLRQAFTTLLRRRGRPVTMSVASDVAQAFPRNARRALPAGTWCLAVGVGRDGRACYSLQSAQHPSPEIAEHAARCMALAKLEAIGMNDGFPLGPAKGQA
jgi:hypothetical protein